MNSTKNSVTTSALRIFVVVLFVLLTGCAYGLPFLYPHFYPITALALVGLGAGCLWPALVSPFYKAWLKLGLGLGFMMLRVQLALLYYLIFTPIALFFRLIGRDVMELRKNNKQSYWKAYNAHPAQLERYRRLF